VSYFAAAFARADSEWLASEIDLDDAEDIEGIAEMAAQVESDDGLVVVLLEDEEWFGVVRVESDEDPRVYVSDAAEAGRSVVGQAVLSELASEYGADSDPDFGGLPAEPLGETGLLDDLGVRGGELARLAGSTSTPSDVVATLAERLGFVEALETVR
jgi:putative tRNA adenosine deaminase-associated protein